MSARQEEDTRWDDGRIVFRRPEVRNSNLQRSYIVHTEAESMHIAKNLAATVERRRAQLLKTLEKQLHEPTTLEPEVISSDE